VIFMWWAYQSPPKFSVVVVNLLLRLSQVKWIPLKKFSEGPELINLLSGKTSQKGSLKIVIELYPL
jgi:hypothetical protein